VCVCVFVCVCVACCVCLCLYVSLCMCTYKNASTFMYINVGSYTNTVKKIDTLSTNIPRVCCIFLFSRGLHPGPENFICPFANDLIQEYCKVAPPNGELPSYKNHLSLGISIPISCYRLTQEQKRTKVLSDDNIQPRGTM